MFLAASDLDGLSVLAGQEIAYSMCRSKLAEVLEKLLKGELLRLGWFLERTHDLEKLLGELKARGSDLAPQCEPLCEELAEAYFSDRYPGFDLEDPDWPNLRTRLEQVKTLLEQVRVRTGGG